MAKKLIALLLTALMLFSVLTACASDKSTDTDKNTNTDVNTNTDSDSSTQTDTNSDTSASTVITDMLGREVTLPDKIETIATFGACGVLNTLVETLGCGSMICNDMAPSFTKSDKWAMQYEFAPQMTGAPVLQNADGEVLIEDTLSLAPDLCLTMQAPMVESLEAAGFAVVYFNWDDGDSLKEAVRLLGSILQVEDTAESYCAYFDETVAKAESLVAGLDDSEKKTVIYGDVTTLSNPHLISEWWITEGGGISVTKDMHTEESLTYTTEDLFAWNPDVMFVTSDQAEDIKADSQLSGVTAVKDGAIYVVPTVGHTWGNRSTEQPLVILWTINKLYPELYSVQDFSQDIKDFYSTFFNYELTDEQVAKIIG